MRKLFLVALCSTSLLSVARAEGGDKMVEYLTEVSFLPVRTGSYREDQGYEWFGGL